MKIETMRVCIALAVLQSVSILGCAQSGQRLTPPFFVNQPFAQGSPFNIELPANPKLDPESTSIINGLNIMAAGNVWGLQPGTTGWTLEAAATPADSDFSFPVYFSVSTDPLYTINCNGYARTRNRRAKTIIRPLRERRPPYVDHQFDDVCRV